MLSHFRQAYITAIAAGPERLRNDPVWRSAVRAMAGIEVTGGGAMLPTTEVRAEVPNVASTN
jgi:hypothetical protein